MRGRPAALLGFSLAFISTLAIMAAAAELQLGPVASLMDWFYNVSAKLGHKASVKPSIDWDYVLLGSGSGKAIAAEGFGLAYSVNVTLQEITSVLRVEIKPSSYGGSPQVIGVYAGKWYIGEVKGVTADGAPYTLLTLQPGSYSITRVALGHSSSGWSDPTHVVISIVGEDREEVICNTQINSHTWDCSNCYGSSYFESVPVSCSVNIEAGNITHAADIAVNSSAFTPSTWISKPQQLFVIHANGTGAALGGGGGQVCSTPRECGLKLSWGRVYYTDAMGNPASPAAGRQVLIHFPIHAQPSGKYGKALVLVEVHRYDSVTGTVVIDENMAIGVSWALVGDGVEVTLLWWPQEPGTYLIRGYIWNGFPGQVEKWESYIEPLELVVNIS